MRLEAAMPTKQQNLVAAGVMKMIFYYENDLQNGEFFELDGSAVYTISPESGAGIVNTYIAGGTVTANYTPSFRTRIGYSHSAAGQPAHWLL